MLMLPTGQSATQAPQPLHDSAWMLGWVRAPAGGKADGLLLAAVLTALAEHLGSGQTARLDMGHILPGCLVVGLNTGAWQALTHSVQKVHSPR
jgi:hypothetical protein